MKEYYYSLEFAKQTFAHGFVDIYCNMTWAPIQHGDHAINLISHFKEYFASVGLSKILNPDNAPECRSHNVQPA